MEEEQEVPLDYLVSVHKKLNQTFEKIRETLGESTALMFFSVASEYDPIGKEMGGDLDFLGGKLST